LRWPLNWIGEKLVRGFRWRWWAWALLQVASVYAAVWYGFDRSGDLDLCRDLGRPCGWFD